jgi:hypothetical protein
MDSGSSWAIPLIMPGGQGERWLSNLTGSSVVGGPFQLDAEYAHQFLVEVGVSTPAGGGVGTSTQWRDQGSSVLLNQTSSKQWSFAYWQGATPFSYNGTAPAPTLLVTGPANETAIFFPGLNISTEERGAVAYSYGSINGTVPAGTNETIYVPPGRTVTLTAMPSTVEIVFEGWTGAPLKSTSSLKLQAEVVIYSPAEVHGSFAIDYNDIRVFAMATLGVSVAACYVFVVKRRLAP